MKKTEKISIRLFRGDKEKIAQLYPHIGYNKAIRNIVRNFIKNVEASANEKLARIKEKENKDES